MSNERVPQKELKLYICKLKNFFFPPVLVPRVSWKVITISAAMPVFWAMKGNIARGMLWSYHTETTRHICFFAFRLAEMIIVLRALLPNSLPGSLPPTSLPWHTARASLAKPNQIVCVFLSVTNTPA